MELPQEAKQIFWTLLKCLFPIKGKACLYSRDESQTWGWRIDQDIGEAKHNDFPNQTKGLALVNDFSKPNWIWFGIFRALTKVIKISKPIWIWFRNLAKSVFFFPNQTGIGSENPTHFLGVTFPNQSVFGLERGTEWNVAALQWFQTFRPIYSDNYLVQSVFNNTDSCLLAFVDIHTCKN